LRLEKKFENRTNDVEYEKAKYHYEGTFPGGDREYNEWKK